MVPGILFPRINKELPFLSAASKSLPHFLFLENQKLTFLYHEKALPVSLKNLVVFGMES